MRKPRRSIVRLFRWSFPRSVFGRDLLSWNGICGKCPLFVHSANHASRD